MSKKLRSASARLVSSSNRIALVWALRGTVATGLPIVVLPLVGLGSVHQFVAVGALNTSMSDVGGSYHGRLAVMGLNAVLSPIVFLLGSQVQGHWWLATALMLVIALGSGLARALGPGGISLGLVVGSVYLIGLGLPGSFEDALQRAALYVAGALWTIALALAFWRLRPYKRLEQEVAAVWEATAALVAAVRALRRGSASIVQRRRRERVLAKRHQLLRQAIEQARAALGTVRAEVSGPGTTMAELLVLLRAASQIAAIAVAFAETTEDAVPGDPDVATRALIAAAAEELEKACHEVARSLLAGKGEPSAEPLRARLSHLTSGQGGMSAEAMELAEAMNQLEIALEAMGRLFGGEHRLPGILLPPLSRPDSAGALLKAVRAQLSLQSAIFRHALRVAVAAAIGTAVMLWIELPHGIWLPMTTLVVLQPEFGGTLSRALQRTAGTIGGAVLAGLLLVGLHGTPAYEAAILLLLFAAFFTLRRRYGQGVTFLTPLIILLLPSITSGPWLDALERILDTAAGAALGLLAGYLLWPQWEWQRLPAQLARAIQANRQYMSGVLQALAGKPPSAQALTELRRRAEIETGNAEAAFQRLLAEPRAQRGRIARAFGPVTYLQRLERHLIALAAQIGSAPPAAADLAALERLLAATLDETAAAISEGRAPVSVAPFDAALRRLRAVLTQGAEAAPGALIAFLLGRVVSDTMSLSSAAAGEGALSTSPDSG